MTVIAADVVAAARYYKGMRYRHQGRAVGREPRIDCVGLVVCVAHDLELSSADFVGYDRRPDNKTLIAALRKYLVICSDNALAPGLVAAFDSFGEPAPCHVGIVADRQPGIAIIHASLRSRKVVEHVLNEDWQRKVRAVFAFPGVAYV